MVEVFSNIWLEQYLRKNSEYLIAPERLLAVKVSAFLSTSFMQLDIFFNFWGQIIFQMVDFEVEFQHRIFVRFHFIFILFSIRSPETANVNKEKMLNKSK